MKQIEVNLLEFEAVAKVSESMAYGSCSMCNGLFEINLFSGLCNYVALFPNEKIDADRLHAKAVKIKNKIYFIPAAADYIAVYDIENKKLDSIELDIVDKTLYKFYKPRFKFSDGIFFKNSLFIISSTYPAIIRLNPYTHKIEYYRDWIPREGYFFRKGTYVYKNKFYIPSVVNNFVLEFNMQNMQGKQHFVGEKNHGSWSMCGNEEEIWLIPKLQGAVTYWNLLSGEVKSYDKYPNEFQGNNFLFTKSYFNEEDIIMIPALANMAISISCKTGVMKKVEILKMEDKSEIGFMFSLDNSYYLKTVSKKCNNKLPYIQYLSIDIGKNRIKPYQFIFNNGREKFLEDYSHKIDVYSNIILRENSQFNLKEFIKHKKKEDVWIEKQQYDVNGNRIYQEM